MKKVFWTICMIAGFAFPAWNNLAHATAETKKVCHDKVKDGKPVLDKTGKQQQNCKTIKVHQKLDGTKVDDVKKK